MGEHAQDITLEMLPPAQREVAELIGLDNYLLMVEFVNGDSVYFPKYDSLFEGQQRIQRDEEIIAKFTGFNLTELAKEYNLTTRTMYNIIPRSVRNNKRNGPIAGQMSIDDFAG
ncbi:DNA-binding protein [Ruminococcaceae bacterium OttesenSCG-928-A11]|nr:DNA-binding protein [Ruminococcaceae bacterium OttesenSCG-928-A11]